MNVIEIENLTKDYGNGQGIFGIDLTIAQGEMIGFVGTNGSGKTTTIRSILGFLKPTDMRYANELIEKLQLDPRANLKRMSKGMKQKTALVAALMNDSPILLLDEPTTGLDPLMRVTFLDIIRNEHRKGKTIFMSSHLFEELETTCDRVALIDNGKIIDIADMNAIRNRPERDFKIEFKNRSDFEAFRKENYRIVRTQEQYFQVTARIPNEEAGRLLRTLKAYDVKFISELPYTLEKHFKTILKEKKEEIGNVQ